MMMDCFVRLCQLDKAMVSMNCYINRIPLLLFRLLPINDAARRFYPLLQRQELGSRTSEKKRQAQEPFISN